jgi:hypothetical protein
VKLSLRSLALPEELTDQLKAQTDARGRARLVGFGPGDLLWISVRSPSFGKQVGAPAALGPNGDLGITMRPVGQVVGRLVADDQGLVAKRHVSVFTFVEGDQSSTSGGAEATTDDQGRFEMPAVAAGKLSIVVQPRKGAADRARPPRDVVVESGKRVEVSIPLVGPVRFRQITGKVVDRQGEPIAGALVIQQGDTPTRTECQTDERGRFSLAEVAPRRTFVFASKPGYRFQGELLAPQATELTIRLIRSDGPVEPMKTLSPVLPHDEELALAKRLLDPYLKEVLKRGGEAEKVRTCEALAKVDPARLLELIDQKTFDQPFFNDMFRLRVATGLVAESPEEALNLAEAMADPFFRSTVYMAAIDQAERAKKADLLAQALLHVTNVKDPSFKAIGLGQIGERWLDLGEVERATKLLRDGQAIAKELPVASFGGYARGSFAEELAQIDLPAALELTNDLSDPREFDRHHGNIAHELAGKQPAEAERILSLVRDAMQRDQYAQRVCYRMAPKDLPRARRIAETMRDSALRCYAQGLMAMALTESNRSQAQALLAETFAELEKVSRAKPGPNRSFVGPAVVAAVLLNVAEQVEPTLVREHLWRCLSYRSPVSLAEMDRTPSNPEDATLAIFLARYDRPLARAVLEPLTTRNLMLGEQYRSSAPVPVAAAMIDPMWSVELLEGLPQSSDVALQQPQNYGRLAVAHALARQGERRWRHVHSTYSYLWVPDVEDNDPDL